MNNIYVKPCAFMYLFPVSRSFQPKKGSISLLFMTTIFFLFGLYHHQQRQPLFGVIHNPLTFHFFHTCVR